MLFGREGHDDLVVRSARVLGRIGPTFSMFFDSWKSETRT